MKHFFLSALHNKRLVRYFFMAISIVGIELVTFQIIYLANNNYVVATVISFVVGVILNWVVGRILVFGKSVHHPFKEFLMVLIGSIAGVLIQILVVYTSVTILNFYPLVGKALSIIFSFFWNYLFRSRIVYKQTTILEK